MVTDRKLKYKYCIILHGIFFILELMMINPLNAKLNPICHLLALLGAHHILHVSRIRVNSPRKGSRSGTTLPIINRAPTKEFSSLRRV